MRWFKGIFLLIITNLLIFFTLAITGSILINVILPNFGIDLRGSVATHEFAWAMVFGFGGAFISLFMSKWLAKRGMRMQQVVDPSTPKEKVVFNTVRELARREGILLDPTYSGKTFAVLLEMLRRSDFDADDHVVFLHTGGAASVFAYPELVENE